jgi:hypothetical protein
MRRELWLSVLGLCGFGAIAFAADGFRAAAQRHYLAASVYEDVYYLPPSDWLVLGSLGYRAALADLIWMKALIYYGDELAHRGDVRHLYRYGDALLALDPDFKKVYHWIASCALYRTGTVGVDDAKAAIHYLEQGARRFPDDGELAWDLGANYTYELAPMLKDPVERERAREQGLAHLEAAVLRHAGPPWLVLQNSTQLEKLGRREQAIRHLEDVYAAASDASIKLEIERELTRLRSAAYADALRQSDQELASERQKNFPYLDDTLFLLVGPRPPFGGDAWLAHGFDPSPPARGDDD